MMQASTRSLHGLTEAAITVDWDDNFPGHRRCYANDPFGNRIEFLEPETSG